LACNESLLIDSLVLAVIGINKKLESIKTALSADYVDLMAYNIDNPSQINGEEITVKKYQQAVFSYAKAHFLDQSKDSNRREEAKALAAEMPETRDEWLIKSSNAVNFLFTLLLPDMTPTSGIRARLIEPTEPTYYA